MDASGDCLGLCFADRQLYYAVRHPRESRQLRHIGSIDCHFPLLETLSDAQSESFDILRGSIEKLREKYECREVRLLAPALHECWSVCPRLVQEASDEREEQIAVLMGGVPRQELETTWHALSNRDFRLLSIRNRNLTENFRSLAGHSASLDVVSEFELGTEWQLHTGIKGSYLTVHAQSDYLSVCSCLLGKLRGATWLRYDSLNDLPYLWNHHAAHLSWMNGYHEQVYVYGPLGLEVAEMMSTFFSETDRLQLMNSLSGMQVDAEEKTYGFRLEGSFPAVLLSLNLSREESAGPP